MPTSHPDHIVSKGHLRFTLKVIVWASINEAISQTPMNTTMNHLEMNEEKASNIVAKNFTEYSITIVNTMHSRNSTYSNLFNFPLIQQK